MYTNHIKIHYLDIKLMLPKEILYTNHYSCVQSECLSDRIMRINLYPEVSYT